MATETTTDSDDSIYMEHTVERTDDPDMLRVQINIHSPSNVTSYSLTHLPEDITLETTKGFSETDDGRLRWEGYSDPATVTYTITADQQNESFDGYDSVRTDEWAFVSAYTVQPWVQYNYTGTDPGITISMTPSESETGFGSTSFAYLGEYTTHHSSNNRLTLIEPATATPTEDPDDILAVLETSSDLLDIGGESEQVNVFMTQDPVRGGGAASPHEYAGTTGFWAHETERLDRPRNVWLHEYIHTRQDFETTDEMHWIVEGQADYYAARLGLHNGSVDFDVFYDHVTFTADPDATLADDETWDSMYVPYQNGRHALAGLDVKIRQATDGEYTVDEVFRRLTEHEGEITTAVFEGILRDIGGDDLYGWTNTYVQSDNSPTVSNDPQWFIRTDTNGDSTGNGLSDEMEVALELHPFKVDTAGDGYTDAEELFHYRTDPTTKTPASVIWLREQIVGEPPQR